MSILAKKKKTIAKSDITGDRGIALIHRVVSDMGHIWTPKGLEAGIDGFIEMREDSTSAVGAQILQVQSKAGESYFRAERDGGFTFYCDEADVDYWMQANTPVLLVVSRPENGEAYWVHVQDYFKDPAKRTSRKIVFQKAFQRFDVHAKDAVERLAVPAGATYYSRVAEETETLFTNLCPLIDYPARIFRAKTKIRSGNTVRDRLRQSTSPRNREWVLHGGFLYSFDDLSFETYRQVHYSKVPDNLPVEEYAESNDRNKRYVFTRLLNSCVRNLLFRQGVRFHKDKGCFYFQATADLAEQKIGKLSIFKPYPFKKEPERIAYYRHRACRLDPLRVDGNWHLEITPTYHFTYDGIKPSRYYEDALSQIKIIERQNKTHLRQVQLWEEILTEQHVSTEPKPVQQNFFESDMAIRRPKIEQLTEKYVMLRFGSLVKFEASWKVPEKHWLAMGRADDSGYDPQMELF